MSRTPLASWIWFVAVTCASHSAQAQKTGTFSDSTLADSGRGGVRGESRGRPAVPRAAVNNRALMVDPSASSSLRASGWTFVIARGDEKEGRIQANLCDLLPCGAHGGWDLTLAGPVDGDARVTPLADLNGLVGKSRVESGYSYGVGADRRTTFDIRATYARYRSTYRTTGTLTRASFTGDAGAFTIGAGEKWKTSSAAMTLLTKVSYRRQKAFRSADSHNLCVPSPLGPAGTLECEEVVVGKPVGISTNVVAVEQWMSIAGVAGIRLKISRDLDDKVTGFDAPIYILPDGRGGIGGGVRIGYRTDDKTPRFSLFVGALTF